MAYGYFTTKPHVALPYFFKPFGLIFNGRVNCFYSILYLGILIVFPSWFWRFMLAIWVGDRVWRYPTLIRLSCLVSGSSSDTSCIAFVAVAVALSEVDTGMGSNGMSFSSLLVM